MSHPSRRFSEKKKKTPHTRSISSPVSVTSHIHSYTLDDEFTEFLGITNAPLRFPQKQTRKTSIIRVLMLAASSAVVAPIVASRPSGVNTQCVSGRNTRSNATFSGRTGQSAEVAGYHAAPLSARGCGAFSRCVLSPHHIILSRPLRERRGTHVTNSGARRGSGPSCGAICCRTTLSF